MAWYNMVCPAEDKAFSHLCFYKPRYRKSIDINAADGR